MSSALLVNEPPHHCNTTPLKPPLLSHLFGSSEQQTSPPLTPLLLHQTRTSLCGHRHRTDSTVSPYTTDHHRITCTNRDPRITTLPRHFHASLATGLLLPTSLLNLIGGTPPRSRPHGSHRPSCIPYGIVHLKAKKQWQKGRAIISYYQSLAGNLLRIGRRWEAVEKMVADNESLARCKASAWRKNGMEGWFS